MAYSSMKKLILNQNNKLNNGEVSQEDYDLWKEGILNKLDVFFTCGRLTENQMRELSGMLRGGSSDDFDWDASA